MQGTSSDGPTLEHQNTNQFISKPIGKQTSIALPLNMKFERQKAIAWLVVSTRETGDCTVETYQYKKLSQLSCGHFACFHGSAPVIALAIKNYMYSDILMRINIFKVNDTENRKSIVQTLSRKCKMKTSRHTAIHKAHLISPSPTLGGRCL